MSGIIGGAGSRSGIIGTTELDYEEGTWTPRLYIGGTEYPTANYKPGVYTRVGNALHLSFYWYHAGTTGGTGAMQIKGLPFVSTRHGSGVTADASYPSLTMGYNMHSGASHIEHAGRWQLQGSSGSELEYRGTPATKTGAAATIELSGYGVIPI